MKKSYKETMGGAGIMDIVDQTEEANEHIQGDRSLFIINKKKWK